MSFTPIITFFTGIAKTEADLSRPKGFFLIMRRASNFDGVSVLSLQSFMTSPSRLIEYYITLVQRGIFVLRDKVCLHLYSR